MLTMSCDTNVGHDGNNQEELEKIVYKVVQKRKFYPKKSSVLLTKRLKMEHFIREDTKILMDRSMDNVSLDEFVSVDSAAIKSEPLIESSVVLSKIAALEKEADNILAVFEQLKSEKNCEMINLCFPQMPSNG